MCAAEDAGRLRDALGVAVPGRACPAPAPSPSPRRSSTSSRATPAPTARSSCTTPPLATASAPTRCAPRSRCSSSDGRVVRGEFRPDGVEREWCDGDVLRQLRRRSLAALRKEVEPVDAGTLARFLPRWHGIGQPRRGIDALVDVVAQLQGAPLVASALDRDILRVRLPEHEPGRPRRAVHVGRRGVGRRRRHRLHRRPHPPGVPRPGRAAAARRRRASSPTPLHTALLDHLEQRGASFWTDLTARRAAGRPALRRSRPCSPRCGTSCGRASSRTTRWRRCAPSSAPTGRRSAGRVRVTSRRARPPATGPAEPPRAAGRRRALVARRAAARAACRRATEAAHARALQLLERYGVLTREAALGEGAEGGFAGVYPVLKALEERGQVRRGYFVAGLGAAQFAVAGAVDRLRREQDDDDDQAPVVLAATDPAQPFGAAIPWPESTGRPARAAGALRGARRGRRARVPRARRPQGAAVPGRGRRPPLGRRRWRGWWTAVASDRSRSGRSTASTSTRPTPTLHDALRRAGFQPAYKGWIKRAR